MEEVKKSKEMDMLNGGLAGKLIIFAIPLAFSSILQQLFNSADVAVVRQICRGQDSGSSGKLRGSGWYFCKPSGFSPAARFW